jgi:hypothetical protein
MWHEMATRFSVEPAELSRQDYLSMKYKFYAPAPHFISRIFLSLTLLLAVRADRPPKS